MSTTKNKPGRPKKVVTESPKKEVKNAAFYKNIAQEIAEANDVLEARLQRALEDKEYWFQVADKAHKENETIVSNVKQTVDETISSILSVHELTGEINPIDIIYNVSMIDRMIQAKYNSDSEEF
jgi:L-lactate utilization protein LutB